MEDFQKEFEKVFDELSYTCLCCNSYLQMISKTYRECQCGYEVSYKRNFFSANISEIRVNFNNLYCSIYTNLDKVIVSYKYIREEDSNIYEVGKDSDEIINCVKSIYNNRIFI